MKHALPLALAFTTLSLAACNPANPVEEAAAPETAATMPEGVNETTGAIEPGIGAVVTEGGGVPGASTGNPAAAPAVSTPPDTPEEAEQTPQKAPDA